MELEIKFTEEDLKRRLEQVFKTEHKTLMTECITGLLAEDSERLEILLKAALGIRPDILYKVGDQVWCDYYALSSWKWQNEEMVNSGLLKDELIMVTITRVSEFNPQPYVAEYEYIDSDTHTRKKDFSFIKSTSLKGIAEMIPECLPEANQ